MHMDHRTGAHGPQNRRTRTTEQAHTDHRAGAHGPQSRIPVKTRCGGAYHSVSVVRWEP
ncbi:hypothetical protein LEMLEM_LOCUS3757, partial [Lemmus lemmus]